MYRNLSDPERRSEPCVPPFPQLNRAPTRRIRPRRSAVDTAYLPGAGSQKCRGEAVHSRRTPKLKQLRLRVVDCRCCSRPVMAIATVTCIVIQACFALHGIELVPDSEPPHPASSRVDAKSWSAALSWYGDGKGAASNLHFCLSRDMDPMLQASRGASNERLLRLISVSSQILSGENGTRCLV